MYGNSPIILFIKININNLMIISLIPWDFFPKSILNSLYRDIYNFWFKIFTRLGKIQNRDGIIISPMRVLVQFIDIFMLVAGSKVENKFVIIFNLYLLYFL